MLSGVDRLTMLIAQLVGTSAIVRVQNPIWLDDYSEPQPDIAVLRLPGDHYRYGHPQPVDVQLVVEVADTSYQYDHDTKVPLYARAGIPEVWLVALQSGEIEIYNQPVDGVYQQINIVTIGQSFGSEALDGVIIEVERS